MFKSVDTVLSLDKESDLDIITAISGSGPAYFLLVQEMLMEAAIALGLDGKIAYELAQQTMLGTSLLTEDSGDSFQETREKVTSKGGTTAAATEVLIQGGIETLFQNAVNAALKKSTDLGGTKNSNSNNFGLFAPKDDAQLQFDNIDSSKEPPTVN